VRKEDASSRPSEGRGGSNGSGGKSRRPLSVSRIEDSSEAFFTESVEVDHSDHELHQRLAQKLNITKPPLQVDSQAKYGIVARGEAVLYLRMPSPVEPNYKENIWDHAAGAIITEEAGGESPTLLGSLSISCQESRWKRTTDRREQSVSSRCGLESPASSPG